MSVTVGITCHTEDRWDQLTEAIASVRSQDHPHRLVVSVDHNRALFERLRAEYPDVDVVENRYQRGVSGSRNTIALDAPTPLVVFLEDDAFAEPGWLAALVHAMDDPDVIGAGSRILPVWHTDEPGWFPGEFGWVIGATLPERSAEPVVVRNVWTGGMIVRRDVFAAVGGFREDFGKVGNVSEPEDTELCLRMARSRPGGRWLRVPAAVIRHHVPAERSSVAFFLRRCWLEGRGKAGLAKLTPDRAALSEESNYLRRVLPRGLRAYLLQGDVTSLAKAGMVIAGVASTGAGFALQMARVGFR